MVGTSTGTSTEVRLRTGCAAVYVIAAIKSATSDSAEGYLVVQLED